MLFREQTNHSGAYCHFYLLNSREYKKAQFFIKTIKTYDSGKTGVRLKSVSLSVFFHQSPIAG